LALLSARRKFNVAAWWASFKADRPQFIFNIVGCVMNAYNNITWESDRLEFEEGSSPYGNMFLSIIGIPSEPKKGA
jgi:hypothetical protein